MDKLCILVRELLPLYKDGVCGSAVTEVMEEHLRDCKDCRRCLELLRSVLPGEAAAALPAEALEPAAPFARVWRYALRRAVLWVLAAVLAVTALLLTVCTLRGDGYTWFSLPAYITAERLADAVVDMDPVRMGSRISFTGVGPQDELEIREKLWTLALEDGVHLNRGWAEFDRCAADDGVQELSVFFEVGAGGSIYIVEFPGSLWELWRGKAALRHPLVMDRSTGRYVEPLWLDSLADALCTHDPG